MHEWRAKPVAAAVSGVGAAAVVALALTACSGLTPGAANQTLPPLTLPGPTSPPITQPLVPNTQGTVVTTTIANAVENAAPDNANPLSVASRFLVAAASGDPTTGAALEAQGRAPSVYDWAHNAYAEYTAAAGAGVWGQPTCSDPVGTAPAPITSVCTWLSTPDAPTLVLVQDAGTWKVSHAASTPGGGAEPTQVGAGCILGNDNVNFRGGPGKDWSRFDRIPIGSCDVTMFDVVESEPSSGDQWRYVEFGGQRGWIVDRAIRAQ